MIAISSSQIRSHFKEVCDQLEQGKVTQGELIVENNLYIASCRDHYYDGL